MEEAKRRGGAVEMMVSIEKKHTHATYGRDIVKEPCIMIGWREWK